MLIYMHKTRAVLCRYFCIAAKHPAEGVMNPQLKYWTLFLCWHLVPIIQKVLPVWSFHSDSLLTSRSEVKVALHTVF